MENLYDIIRSMSEDDTMVAVEAMRRLQAGDNDGAMATLSAITTDGLTKLEAALIVTMMEREEAAV